VDFTGCIVEVIQLKHSIEGTNIAFIHVFFISTVCRSVRIAKKNDQVEDN
jgi:hypothetical protein